MTIRPIIAAVIAIAALTACSNKQSTHDGNLTLSGLDPRKFVTEVDGKPTALYTLTNPAGMEVCITNYGGRIVSIMAPGADGSLRDVVLGFDSIQAYFPQNNATDFGAAIGRYANRINKGKFHLDGDTITLPTNNFGHTLHGGPTGWQYKVYDVKAVTDTSLTLAITSPDGDNGFPGNVEAQLTYTLTSNNAIDIAYQATTDAPTVINLTNHSYFNLEGNPDHDISDNILYINADTYTPIDSTFMTTGEILPVATHPVDFLASRRIDTAWDDPVCLQIHNASGIDHNYILNTAGDITHAAARVKSPTSGIILTVYTDQPGLQVYTGNFLDGTNIGKHNIPYPRRAAICLEPQLYPDSPNKPDWPSPILRPGETYTSHIIYQFTIE